MPGAVGSIAGAARGSLAVVARVSTEAALVNAPVFSAVERQAAMFQFVDGIDSLPRQDLCGGLVYEIITAFDRVIHMPFPVIFFLVAERGGHASLGCACVGARGGHFTQHGNTGIWKLYSGHQATATASANDHHEFIVPTCNLVSSSIYILSSMLEAGDGGM